MNLFDINFKMKSTFKSILKFSFIINVFIIILFVGEYFMLYLSAYKCNWPLKSNNYLNTMILTDLHLLGSRKSYWFDRIKRDWEMATMFSIANSMFKPKLFLFLGDILDEGLTANEHQFGEFVERFKKIFDTGDNPKIIVPGNHDLGFHDRLLAFDSFLRPRFEKSFNTSLASLHIINGIKFVSLNSMTLHGDGCSLCKRTYNRILKIADKLNSDRSILLQHFPLFRESEKNCYGEDSANEEERENIFEPGIDCVSKESSEFILSLIKPRVAFSGHTHNGCITYHEKYNTTEWTVGSFNYRNKKNPSFLLAQFSKDDYFINRCIFLNENVFIIFYIIVTLLLFLLLVRNKVCNK